MAICMKETPLVKEKAEEHTALEVKDEEKRPIETAGLSASQATT